MAAQASIIKPVRLLGVLLSLVLPLGCVLIAERVLGPGVGPIVGLFVYIFYRLVIVRRIVCRDHRRGVVLTRQGKFVEAISAFRRSEEFWERHPTLDRYRALLLGSPTSHGFHLFALYNQAYCLCRLQNGTEARPLIDRVLAKAPDMLPARELRDILGAGETSTA